MSDRVQNRTPLTFFDGSAYPFALILPRDLTVAEAEQVCGVVRALAIPDDQPSLFDKAEPRTIPSRSTDPGTSHAAVRAITVKAGSQRARLLEAFNGHGLWTLTDEEAMEYAIGVSPLSEYSKRCSELREAGYIEPTGETRAGSSGLQRIVCRITDKGRAAVREL